jgi:hypothetical protein
MMKRVLVASLENAYAAVESMQQELCSKDQATLTEKEHEFLTNAPTTLEQLVKQLKIEQGLDEMRAANPELWDAKTKAEAQVQDIISCFYDEEFNLDIEADIDCLKKDIRECIDARNKYFDAVDR